MHITDSLEFFHSVPYHTTILPLLASVSRICIALIGLNRASKYVNIHGFGDFFFGVASVCHYCTLLSSAIRPLSDANAHAIAPAYNEFCLYMDFFFVLLLASVNCVHLKLKDFGEWWSELVGEQEVRARCPGAQTKKNVEKIRPTNEI